MKIKLIAPHELNDGTISIAHTFATRKVNLALLAALTPPEHTVTIVDEALEADDASEDADLVGISVMTELVPRAYQIADDYRRRGVRVVMGGIHPTVLPGEALQHADAVLAGEAEAVWPCGFSRLCRGHGCTRAGWRKAGCLRRIGGSMGILRTHPCLSPKA